MRPRRLLRFRLPPASRPCARSGGSASAGSRSSGRTTSSRSDRKLGGILIDLRSEAAGPAYVVVGIGINVRLPASARERLAIEGVRAVDLATLGEPPPRNALAAALIAELSTALVEYGARGMSAFAEEWRVADALAGRTVAVLHGGQKLEGCARGVDDDGALLLEIDGVPRRIVSGEVSVRPVRC